jgi:hypothetical protein
MNQITTVGYVCLLMTKCDICRDHVLSVRYSRRTKKDNEHDRYSDNGMINSNASLHGTSETTNVCR